MTQPSRMRYAVYAAGASPATDEPVEVFTSPIDARDYVAERQDQNLQVASIVAP